MNIESGGEKDKEERFKFEGEEGRPEEIRQLEEMVRPPSASERQKEQEIRRPVLLFVQAFFADFRAGASINKRLSAKLEAELLRRGTKDPGRGWRYVQS